MDEFIQSKGGGDHSFTDDSLSHQDLMVAPDEINFREDGHTWEGSGGVLQLGYRVMVWHLVVVQPSVITAWTPLSIRFGDHNERGRPLTSRRVDDAHAYHGVEFFFCSLEFDSIEVTQA